MPRPMPGLSPSTCCLLLFASVSFWFTGCNTSATEAPLAQSEVDSPREFLPAEEPESEGKVDALTPTVEAETPSTEVPSQENEAGESPDSQFPVLTESAEPVVAEEVAWIDDFERATEMARRDGRDILMFFTGSDWCGWCIRLNNEVFQFAQFSDYADDGFVLLKLDYPRDRSRVSEETMAQNAELQSRFAIQGYPTVLLADAEGRPYAQTGYQRGGPEFYVQHLEELKQIRVERDRAFADSASLTGIERAQKLHEALEMIEPHLLLPSYDAVVGEIVELDANNEAGLKEPLAEQLAASRFQAAMMGLQRRVEATGDIQSALQELDELEQQFSDFESGRLPIQLARLELLQLDGRADEVITLADLLLSGEIRSRQALFSTLAAKLNAFASTDRLEEALAVIDEMQGQFPDQPRLLVQLSLRSADFLVQLGREADARQAVAEARESAGPQAAAVIDQFEAELFGQSADNDEEAESIE